MLTDLLAANPEEADAILSTNGHASIWPTLEAHTVDQVKLATLALILRGTTPESAAVGKIVESFEGLASGGEDGPWIDRVPNELVQGLAGLSADRIDEVAAKWGSTEEAKLDRWEQADIAVFLQELSAFAASAVAQNKSLLLWVCL